MANKKADDEAEPEIENPRLRTLKYLSDIGKWEKDAF